MGVFLIIFGIIKLVFIILLCVLAVLIFIAVYLVCAPVYYDINVNHHSKTNYKFKVSSFLRTIIISGDSQKNDQIALRIFWIFCKKFSADLDEEDQTVAKNESWTKTPSDEPDKSKETSLLKSKPAEKTTSKAEHKGMRKEKRRLKKEDKKARRKKLESVVKTAKNIKNYPHKKEVIKATIKLIKEVVKAVKPKKLSVECVFGLSDPYETGVTLAAISAIKPFVSKGISVEADFENKTFEIDISAKGWFNLLNILLPLIKYILTKPIWKMIKVTIFAKRKVDNNG